MRTDSGQMRRGFTLLEVVVAVTILSLLTGSIYGLLRSAIEAAADLQEAEQRDMATRQFLLLCREALEALPPDASLEVTIRQEGVERQELTLSGVPDAFRFGGDIAPDGDWTLGLRPWSFPSGDAAGEAVFQVAMTREDFAPEAEAGEIAVRVGGDDPFFAADEEGRYWFPLLPGVRSLQWRFWNEEARIWEDTWDDAAERPVMLEMQLWTWERPVPIRAVFDIPPAPASTTLENEEPASGGGAPRGLGDGGAGRGGEGPPQGRPGGERGPGGPGGRGPGERPGGGGGPGGGGSGNGGSGNGGSGNGGPAGPGGGQRPPGGGGGGPVPGGGAPAGGGGR